MKEETEQDLLNFILDYEIRSSTWAPYISIKWMQKIAGKYFCWKVRRKFKMYKKSKIWEKRFKALFNI